MASVVPWLTFRGLHTDDHEGFSADHRLSFRGLPAECLGVLPREAASLSTVLVGTQREPELWPLVGLFLAAPWVSSPGGRLPGPLLANFPAISVHRKNTAVVALTRVFPGRVFGVGRRPAVADFLESTSLAAGPATLCDATRRGVPQPRGLLRGLLLPSGPHLWGSWPNPYSCGISGV